MRLACRDACFSRSDIRESAQMLTVPPLADSNLARLLLTPDQLEMLLPR